MGNNGDDICDLGTEQSLDLAHTQLDFYCSSNGSSLDLMEEHGRWNESGQWVEAHRSTVISFDDESHEEEYQKLLENFSKEEGVGGGNNEAQREGLSSRRLRTDRTFWWTKWLVGVITGLLVVHWLQTSSLFLEPTVA
jgi:hydrogenase maturation factor